MWDNLPARADKVERALCLAGFAQERIARNIGKFPVLLHAGRRRFWLVAPGVYNASGADGEAPAGAGGYPDLRALFSLKGEPQA